MSDLLPDPPNGHNRWSTMTLAEHLRVPAWKVDALLDTDSEDSPDLYGSRGWDGAYRSYDCPDGQTYGDCWLTKDGAERVAAALPAASIARAIVAAGPLDACQTISGPALMALAEHVLAAP